MFRPIVFVVLLASGSTSAFAPCKPGQSEMSVEGVNGIFCVDGSEVCIADISNGACPPIQNGLPFGSYCGLVATGVYGCKTLDAESIKTFRPPGAPAATPAPAPASVMTTSSVVDTATPSATPAPTTPVPAPVTTSVPAATDGSQCVGGQYEMSVEGVQGKFCLSEGPICMAELKTGTCPGPQNGLPNGSYCGIVASGVFGCKVGVSSTTTVASPAPATGSSVSPVPIASATTAPSPVPVSFPVPVATDGTQCGNGEYEMSVEGVRGVFCLKDGPVCVADVYKGTCPGPQFGLPNGAYCGLVAPGVYGCKVVSGSATTAPAVTSTAPASVPVPATTTIVPAATTASPAPPLGSASSNSTCANGGTPMSVEGVVPIFCVPEPACVANRKTGNCPGSQAGLPWGSYCEVITRTGQHGCKPYKGTNERNNVVYPPVRNCTGNAKGNMPVSVVDVAGEYCAAHPVCAGTQFGNCPVAQDGLARDAKCVAVRAGVFGCVQSA